MKKLVLPLMTVALFVSSAFVTYKSVAADYSIKSTHKLAFKSKDPNGTFTKMTGTVKFDEADLTTSKFDLKIPVSSISCGNGIMNKKAQTEEWFNAGKYPDIKFTSTKIEKSGTNYAITGNVVMKGVTKSLKITASLAKSGTDLTFTATFPVNRMDFKVGKKSDAVPDIMNMTVSLPVSKK